MAFTGTAVITSLGKHCVRITGLSLAAGASGTIGESTDTGADENLPSNFPALNADYTWVNVVDAGSGLGVINHSKGGSPLRITLTNNNAATSGTMEIQIQDKSSIIR